jgi:hypothetical protein
MSFRRTSPSAFRFGLDRLEVLRSIPLRRFPRPRLSSVLAGGLGLGWHPVELPVSSVTSSPRSFGRRRGFGVVGACDPSYILMSPTERSGFTPPSLSPLAGCSPVRIRRTRSGSPPVSPVVPPQSPTAGR